MPVQAVTSAGVIVAANVYKGALSTIGAPTTGNFVVGDYVIDSTGQTWICIVSGAPGTFQLGTVPVTGTATAPAADVGTHFRPPSGAAPIAVAGTNAGSGPPAPVVTAGSDDSRGNITFGTGSGPAAGLQVAVTFANQYPAGVVPIVTVTRADNLAQSPTVELTVDAVSNTGFSVRSEAALAASQANTVFAFDYMVAA